jgi:hypothetical protein
VINDGDSWLAEGPRAISCRPKSNLVFVEFNNGQVGVLWWIYDDSKVVAKVDDILGNLLREVVPYVEL